MKIQKVLFMCLLLLTITACKPKTQTANNTPQPTESVTAYLAVSSLDIKEEEPVLAPEKVYDPDKAYVIFTFDDGYKSDYELAYPLFKELGIRGTSFIIGKYADDNVANTMSWDNIFEMYSEGWDFQCHTYAHSNLKKLSSSEIAQSMQKQNAAFEAHGLSAPQIIAFPYGEYDENAIRSLKEYRKLMRKAYYDDKYLQFYELNPYELDSVSADFRAETRSGFRESTAGS